MATGFRISYNNFPVSLEIGVLYFGVFQFVQRQYQSGDSSVTISIHMGRVRNIRDVYFVTENRMAAARDVNLFFIKRHKTSYSRNNSVMSLKVVTSYPMLLSKRHKLIQLSLNV
jgi:hypothetical protein